MSFRDIKGQDWALGILRENISKNCVFPSYLFVGPDGVGKSEVAKNFAKTVNCLDAAKDFGQFEPCDRCASCNKINLRIHPDVFFVEPKGLSLSITIDQIRAVIAKANLKPYEGKKKVFILDKAHSMNNEASNAFLKTLEEPPKDTVFILMSRSKEALLSTVVSRCYVIRFFTAPLETVENIIMEKFGTERDQARILSNFSCGRIGEAIKMNEEKFIERKNRIIDSLLNTGKGLLKELEAYSDKEELKMDLEFLVSFFRDIFLYKAIKNEKNLFHIDRIAEIKSRCGRFTLEGLDYMIKRIIVLRSYIDRNVNPKIVVDVLTNEVRRFMLAEALSS
ncbi:MAG: hypothetical protein A2Z72_04365 [Omnitrophica bacterium RBG_13_46_9]|nr:MAG: hypothetical protein A2Z72_04365 [Omnitrophica bacterium RBG_13_46_9]